MSTAIISNPASFHAEARAQLVCAFCDAAGEFEAHHVVPKQRLVKLGLVELYYDTRNALRLCEGLGTHKCHHRFEKRDKLPTEKLTNDNICFIWEALKRAGYNFLVRYHTGVDGRYLIHEEGGCSCQRQ